MGWIIFSVIVGLIFSYIFAYEFFEIVTLKGYKDRKYFWFCFLFGIIGYLMVIALPSKNNTTANTSTQSQKYTYTEPKPLDLSNFRKKDRE